MTQPMQPRRLQPAITIRSQKAVDRLKVLTRDGRSQTSVIEEALEKLPALGKPANIDEARIIFDTLAARIAAKPRRFASMAEFDAYEYDERGNPR